MKNQYKKIVKVVSILVVASIVFSCNLNSTPNLGNDKFKLNGTINNTNNNSPYAFTGALNRTDGDPVTAPLPTPTPRPVVITYPQSVQVYNATLVAGSINGIAGTQDGQGANASLRYPHQLICDSQNNIFLVDNFNNIRKIDPNGNVTQVYISTLDNTPLNIPLLGQTITIDSADNIYVAKANSIIKMTPSGIGTTIYAPTSSTIYTNVSNPQGIALDKIAVDQAQNVYFTDSYQSLVKKVSVTGTVSTVAGQPYSFTSIDGQGSSATFNYPWDIISDNNGSFYVSDAYSGKIRKIDSQNNVTTFSGSTYGDHDMNTNRFNAIDGDKYTSKFAGIFYMAYDQNRNNILVADGDKIRKVDVNGNVTTLIINNVDPSVKIKRNFLEGAYGITVDHLGNIFIGDTFSHRIFKLTPSTVSPITPQDNKFYKTTTIANNLTYPNSIAFQDSNSSVFVNDGSGKIRKIDSQNNISDFFTSTITNSIDKLFIEKDNTLTIEGSNKTINILPTGIENTAFSPLYVDINPSITLSYTKDSSGNTYITDKSFNTIRKNNWFTIFAGTLGQYGDSGFQDGGVGVAKFKEPSDITSDSNGNIYVADTGNNAIRKINPSGVVTTLAGSPLEGFKDGNGVNAQFRQPRTLAVDSLGYVYVADTGNNRIRKISPTGDVWTVAGSGAYSYTEGNPFDASFNEPIGIAVDSQGNNIYVADTHNQKIRKISKQ